MNPTNILPEAEARGAAAKVVTVDRLRGLAQIRRPDVNGVLCAPREGLPVGLPLHVMVPGTWREVTRHCSPSEVPTILREALPDADWEQLQWLENDCRTLAQCFSQAADAPRFSATFGPIRGDECRLFHVDNYRLRLLCTYCGPGTEYLADDQVDRSRLGRGSNDGVIRASAAASRTGPGEVLVMKGARYPDQTQGLVHRSPPLEGTGVVRLRLRLTTIDPA